MTSEVTHRLRNAWIGRVSGCMLGKPVEMLSMRRGHAVLQEYLAPALPLRDYVPYVEHEDVTFPQACLGQLEHAIPDDDINYTVLALMIVEEYGTNFTTADVGRAWLNYLPGGMTFTAERAAYVTMLDKASLGYGFGSEPGFDLAECSDNAYNDWIGAQIRADLYGWIAPGEIDLAADMARRDAELSHRAEGVYGAQVVAALGAAMPAASSAEAAIEAAAAVIPAGSDCAVAIELGLRAAADGHGPAAIHAAYDGMSPVHTVNNLALCVWGLASGAGDFSKTIGDTVAAGWDTDCNGATVGAWWGLRGDPIPSHWSEPWAGRIKASLAGVDELVLDDLVARTQAVMT